MTKSEENKQNGRNKQETDATHAGSYYQNQD